MEWNKIEPQIENLKNSILSIMDRIDEQTKSNEKLPKLAPSFTSAYTMIDQPSYDVVVCGEVKKGKSSLLNAIVGQEVLPVNNEIATSQVFRISNSSTEAFYLVFTDGSRKQISRDELTRYGSQVDANMQGEPIFKDHTLSYIQVNIPVAFLPQGVNLVDTPGLGALYKSHEWITQNYVSKASAVVFVMDPERPLVEKEKEFVSKLLDITPHILFVMTKIDMYHDDVLNNVIERNRELLALIYAEKSLEAPQIYPVSSTSLMKVSTGKVVALQANHLKASRFTEMRESLLFTIYRAVGLLQTGVAIREAADQTVKCKCIVDDLLKTTLSESLQEQQQISAKKTEAQSLLSNKWGESSANRKAAISEINEICNSLTSRVQQIVSTSSSIYKYYEQQIDALTSMESAEKLAKTMPQGIIDEVSSQWSSIANCATERVSNVLGRVNAEIGQIGYTSMGGHLSNLETQTLTSSESFSAWSRGMVVGSIGTSLALTLGWFAIPVVGPIIGAIIGIGAILFGNNAREEMQLQRNKTAFKQKLVAYLNELSTKLLHVQGDNNHSIVSEFARKLQYSAEEAIQNLYEEQKKQIEQQLADINRQSQLNEAQRKAEIEKWTKEKESWSNIANEVKSLVAMRNEVATSLGIQPKS